MAIMVTVSAEQYAALGESARRANAAFSALQRYLVDPDALTPDSFTMRFGEMDAEAEAELAAWGRMLRPERGR